MGTCRQCVQRHMKHTDTRTDSTLCWTGHNSSFPAVIGTVIVTVTGVFVLRPLQGDRGRITKQSSVRILHTARIAYYSEQGRCRFAAVARRYQSIAARRTAVWHVTGECEQCHVVSVHRKPNTLVAKNISRDQCKIMHLVPAGGMSVETRRIHVLTIGCPV